MLKKTGKLGESYVIHYLISNGYAVLKQNYYTRYGEIDIIAKKSGKLFFIEVKTRKSLKFGSPAEAFTRYKAVRMRKSIFSYFRLNKNMNWQADLITIKVNSFDEVNELRHYRNVPLFF